MVSKAGNYEDAQGAGRRVCTSHSSALGIGRQVGMEVDMVEECGDVACD